jgi:hypothetical protein
MTSEFSDANSAATAATVLDTFVDPHSEKKKSSSLDPPLASPQFATDKPPDYPTYDETHALATRYVSAKISELRIFTNLKFPQISKDFVNI